MPEIMGYTLHQVSRFIEAIGRQRRAELRDLLVITRAAASDKKGFKAVLKELDSG